MIDVADAISIAFRNCGSIEFIRSNAIPDQKTGTVAYPCTGSVISKRVILTAAHCALAKAEGHRL